MPSRVIRGDDLLESERYMSQTADVQVFFYHCMLVADDFGLLLLTLPFLRRRLYLKPPSDTVLERRIASTAAADLFRIYEHDGVRYAFIPRFRQRMDRYRAKCPMPPPELFDDDENARKKFNDHKAVFAKRATIGGEPVHPDNQAPHISSHLDLDSDLTSKDLDSEEPLPPVAGAAPSATAAPEPVFLKTNVNSEPTPEEWAESLGVEKQPGEGAAVFRLRVMQAKDAYIKGKAA